ncbi:MAG: methyltransferase domain-containing protein [Patescibacteria group bacterium]
MQQNKQYYDDFFSKYPVNVHDNPARFLAVSKMLYGKVLDIACGTGTLADYYLGDYVGVDISSVAIEKAKEVRRKDARFLQADFTKCAPSAEIPFDCAYLGEFLEHIENDDDVFFGLSRLLKSNGKIFITVPNGDRIPDESHCRIFTVPQIRRDYSKFGKITFYNWEGAKERIFFSIELGSKNIDLVSLVMICKDEEKGIENAILSALPLVDRVVVSIDNKTTDKTAQIAKLYADELRMHIWHDHFAETRNEAQQNVKSKWILFLDGHEYIEKTGQIDSLLALDVDGILTTIKMENGTTFMYPRIFRSNLKFENAVHNALDLKTQQYAPKFVIVHDRNNSQSEKSSSERAKQRDRMIPKLMKEVLQRDPKNQRALFNLGNWYITKSEFKLALSIYKRCLKVTPSPDEKYFVLAQIGICHQMLGHDLRATWCFYDLEKLIPNRWETKRLLGGIFIQRGNYKKAVEFLVFALDGNSKHYLYQLFGHDIAELWDLIAACFSELDEPAKAIIAQEEAKKNTTDEKRKDFFQTKINLFKMLLPSSKQ